MNQPEIYDIRNIPHGDEYELGIVVSMNKRFYKQCHCGVAFNLNGDVCILHLATHEDVEASSDLEAEHFLYYIKPNLHPILRSNLNEYLNTIKDEVLAGNNNIMYGFLYDEYATITSEGNLMLGENEVGLTCATYLLTLFHSCSIDLVDINNWPHRPEDDNWFKRILGIFETSVPEEHYEKLLQQEGCPRYRPEEVAIASALYNNAPAPTPIIWEHGKRLWRSLFKLAWTRFYEKQARVFSKLQVS